MTEMTPQTMRARSGLLAEAWYAACMSQELGPSAPLGRTIMEERVVLWRTKDGRAAAKQDRCLHRNARLSEGVVIDGCVACPYHGWTYDEQGRCVAIPSEGPHTERLPTHLALKHYHALERDGLIWIWMGDGEPTCEPFEMPKWQQPDWGCYYMKTPFENNVTNCVENFMDVPHTVFVHAGWFRDASQRSVRTIVERTPTSVLVTYDQPKDSIGFTGRLLNPSGQPMVHTDKFYMPNNTRVDYTFGQEHTAFIITSTCTPVSEYETMVYTLISYKMGRLLNPIAKLILPWYTRQVINQDVEIMHNQGDSLKHHGQPEFNSTAADALHVHIETLRSWAASGGQGERPEPAREEMTFWI